MTYVVCVVRYLPRKKEGQACGCLTGPSGDCLQNDKNDISGLLSFLSWGC
jgi:hypothetical protein